MPTIKAPYNFVPFNKQVVSPHWIDQISHDLPFHDGLSGKIDVQLTAMSPLFVRDGIGQAAAQENIDKDKGQLAPHTFSQYQGKYFLPSTSLKGMVRSVLEILSFGSMENKVNDHRYSVRDFQNKDLYDPSTISRQVECGWLQKVEGEYKLEHCGKPRRISHKSLAEYFKIDISQFFQVRGNLGDKSAKMKYEKYPQITGQYQFETWEDKNGRLLSKISSDGELSGKIVFTGQPSERQEARGVGKHLEFVFPDRGMPAMPVPEEVIENFFFAYYDHDKTNQKADWKYWKPKLEKGEKIPIFFRKDGTDVKDMGLSMLYKITYNNSIVDAITQHQGKGHYDLSDAIFGYVNGDKTQLRGRVQIGHAFSENATPATTSEKEVLSGPKASYYPNYVRQKIKDGKVDGYSTFMDRKPEIAGWKRYPVHSQGIKHNPLPANTKSEKILTKFTPIQAGAVFTCSIRYHNLRPMELGALLSALTFHGTDHTYHSIGMAKPLGYGKLKLEIINEGSLNLPERLCDFEAYMNSQLTLTDQSWNTLDQVSELITICKDGDDASLAYMSLEEHLEVKKKKDSNKKPKPREALDYYSNIVGHKASAPNYCDEEAIERMRTLCEEEMKVVRHTEQIGDVITKTRESSQNDLHQPFVAWKEELLAQLRAKRKAVKDAEIKAKMAQYEEEATLQKAQKKQRAKDHGPDLDGIDPSRSKSFQEFVKRVETFGRDFHQQTDKQLRSEHSSGFVPEEFQTELLGWLKQYCREGLRKKNRQTWIKKGIKNSDIRRLVEMLGEARITIFLEELNQNS